MTEVTLRTGKELTNALYDLLSQLEENNDKLKPIYVNKDVETEGRYYSAANRALIFGHPIEVQEKEDGKVRLITFGDAKVVVDKEANSKFSKNSMLGVLNVDDGKEIVFFTSKDTNEHGDFIKVNMKLGKPQEINPNSVGGYSF